MGLLALVGALVRALRAGVSESDRPGVLVAAGVLGALALAAWNYRAIEIRVTRRALEARYGLFNRTIIPLSEIAECHTTRASFGRYLGIGVRLGVDGSRAYTTSFGPALEVRRRSRGRFVVSSGRPEELCQAIQRALASPQPSMQ